MSDLARRLMRIDEKTAQTTNDSAIFGAVGSLAQNIGTRPPYRIGLWPCKSTDAPILAMGVWSILAHLLERWQDVLVYRLFLPLDADAETFDFEYDIAQTQFDADDWALDDLDENIAIWGVLKDQDDSLELVVSIENDLLEEEITPIQVTATSWGDLINKMPDLANELITIIDAERLDTTKPAFQALPELDADFEGLAEVLVRWQGSLLAHLWGYEWDDEALEDTFDELLEEAQDFDAELGSWIMAQVLRQAMRPGLALIGDLLVPKIDEIIAAFPNSTYVPIFASDGLFELGYAQESYNLLSRATVQQPDSVAAWLKLADLYTRGGRLLDAVDVIQSAIENEATSHILYRFYGNVLQVVERYGEPLDAFILIDLDEREDDYLLWESIEAYQEALKAKPDDVSALHAQLLQLSMVAEHEETRLWDGFRKLLELDQTGERIRDVIENLYDVPDIMPAREAIEAKMQLEGERLDLYINLAMLHLSQDAGDEAMPYLETAQRLASNDTQKADVERLMLVAGNPEFEQRLGEILAVLDAGNTVTSSDVELLEDAVEDAPHWINLQIALARAYYNWDDADAALEVLLDTQKTLPDNPEVLDMLGRVLWEAGEHDLAFQYLNRGLERYPNYVPLLVRVGRYLFENKQLKDARAYLAHAEQIAPNDPALRRIRAFIANEVAKNPDLYIEDPAD